MRISLLIYFVNSFLFLYCVLNYPYYGVVPLHFEKIFLKYILHIGISAGNQSFYLLHKKVQSCIGDNRRDDSVIKN